MQRVATLKTVDLKKKELLLQLPRLYKSNTYTPITKIITSLITNNKLFKQGAFINFEIQSLTRERERTTDFKIKLSITLVIVKLTWNICYGNFVASDSQVTHV
jgi:hypothetical protein